MNINCTVTLAANETLDPNQAAEIILQAVGGDSSKDNCVVTVMVMPAAPTTGTYGTDVTMATPA